MAENDILAAISNALDRQLLEILDNGRETMTRDGDVVTLPPTAADLAVVRQRLKDCGITAAPTENNIIGKILDAYRDRGEDIPNNKLPDIDAGEDSALTG